MSENEFDVLDELYFVQPYNYLDENCGLSENELVETLSELFQKRWIKILKNVDEEEEIDRVDIKNKFRSYFYLATKKGLLKHNTTS